MQILKTIGGNHTTLTQDRQQRLFQLIADQTSHSELKRQLQNVLFDIPFTYTFEYNKEGILKVGGMEIITAYDRANKTTAIKLLQALPMSINAPDATTALKIIQDSIGQPDGDNAGIFFADRQDFIDNYHLKGTYERGQILAKYIAYEIQKAIHA